MNFSLHPRLANDCHRLGQHDEGIILLHKNAWVPWLILVPFTEANELFKLPTEQQAKVQQLTHQLAQFSEEYFAADKLNIATIGNLVPQLHIHIISRFKADSWWPDPVWGKKEFKPYSDALVDEIRLAVMAAIK